MNKTAYYCGHEIRVCDREEVDQYAEYYGVTHEEAAKAFHVKYCPCKGRQPKVA